MSHPHPITCPALGPENRRELLDHLYWMAVHLEAAEALERRADRSPNPTLAGVLRGRATQRREVAERLREDLARHDVVPFRLRGRRP